MSEHKPTVFILDCDVQSRAAVRGVAESLNLRCQEFASGREFFAAYRNGVPGCLVLEVMTGDMSGAQIQKRLKERGHCLPLVFFSKHQDVSLAVELIRDGAIHYLTKPLRPMEMVSALEEALSIGLERHRAIQSQRRIIRVIDALTPGELDVLKLIGEGLASPLIAARLDITVRAVQLRCQALREKVGVKTPERLLRFALLARRVLRSRASGGPREGHRKRGRPG